MKWLTVSTATGYVIECYELAPGTDLLPVLRSKAESLRAGGWEPELDYRSGRFCAQRAAERIEVKIQVVPPGPVLYGPSVPVWR